MADSSGGTLPRQATQLASWPDGSARWVLFDLLVDVPEGGGEVAILDGEPGHQVARPCVVERTRGLAIDTGEVRLEVGPGLSAPLAFVEPDSLASSACALSVEDPAGRPFQETTRRLQVVEEGPILTCLEIDSHWRGAHGDLVELRSHLTCWAGSGLVRVDVRVRNPRRARHKGNLWDLGDPGSILLGDLSLHLPIAEIRAVTCRVEEGEPPLRSESGAMWIHQESSGGVHWNSRNHVNREGQVALAYRGARLAVDGHEQQTLRPSPVAFLEVPGGRVSAAIPRFWQEFPRRIEVDASGIRLGLFPREHGDLFEIQGGEQKTHTAWLQFEAPAETASPLEWVHDPLVAVVDPSYLAATGVFPDLVPEADDPHRSYVEFVQRALDGPRSFFAKRETIDEYGWRSFGDTWADHEDLLFEGELPVISHYNNQYDLIYGFLLQFARSGDPRWLELATDLGRHVLDIDRYHTSEDKPAYNRGLFWHTEHFQDAGRGTHRSYSADACGDRPLRSCGGGPAAEHNYTSGLLLLHYLTGSREAAEAVLEQGDWVLNMDDGSQSLLAVFDRGPTGHATRTASLEFHGPGRGAGNSLNALIDAFCVRGERRYLDAAHALVRRVVHPLDDPASHDLLDVDRRWSYTVFLQALGKLLDTALELGEIDEPFEYARSALLRYADWMARFEVSFAGYQDRANQPTESWPAQDIRKARVLRVASRYADPEDRQRLHLRAEEFYRDAIDQLLDFEICTTTRAFAVMLSAGAPLPDREPLALARAADAAAFPPPEPFRSQRRRARGQLTTPLGWLKLLTLPFRPWVLRRLVTRRLW